MGFALFPVQVMAAFRACSAGISSALIGGCFFLGLIPHAGSLLSASSLNSILTLSALLTIPTLFSRDKTAVCNMHILIAGIAFATSLALSTYHSGFPMRSLELLVNVLSGALLALVAALTSSRKRLLEAVCIALYGALIITTTFCALKMFGRGNGLDYLSFLTLEIVLLRVPNDILCFVVFWPVMAWSINCCESLSTANKLVFGWGYLILVLALSVLVDSRSTFLMSVCCCVGWLVMNPSANVKKYMTALLVLLLASLVFFSPKFLESLLNLPTSSQRVWIWVVSIKMVPQADYIFGIGHGLFDAAFDSARGYIATPDYLLSDSRRIGWAHNIFIEAWVERGYVGLIAHLWLMSALTTYLMRHRSGSAYHKALLGSLVLIILTSLFELTLLRSWVCLAYGLIFGLLVIDSDRAMNNRDGEGCG
jgi:hypothetical protein